MVVKILAVGLLTITDSVATFGWGRFFETVIGLRLPWTFTLVHGLAVFLFLGGILNLMEIAYSEVLDVVVLMGWGIVVFILWPDLKSALVGWISSKFLAREFREWVIPTFFILFAFVYVVATQVPAKAFNFHDNFEKYFVFPVRMLATGTLKAGPFSALGSETLGGRSFLQGLVVSHWPIATINAVDSLFGMLLCLLMATNMAQNSRVPKWLLALFPILVFVINPQIVNVSSSYTGIALFLLLLSGVKWTLITTHLKTLF